MKPVPHPPRLIEDAEFGELIQSAADRPVSPERIRRNRRAIQAHAAGLATTGVLAGTQALALKSFLLTKIVLPLAVAAPIVTTIVLWEGEGEPAKEAVQPVERKIVPPPVEVPVASPEAEPETHSPEEEIEVQEAGESVEKEADETAAEVGRKRKQSALAMSPRAPAETRRESLLPEQLRLFTLAKNEARAGAYGAAISRLDQLRREFPETPLLPEILLTRAEYLVRSGRDEDAVRFINSILEDRRVANKKAQLLLLVGDSWLRRGSCEHAVPAYQRALGLGLGDRESRAARAGLLKCRPR